MLSRNLSEECLLFAYYNMYCVMYTYVLLYVCTVLYVHTLSVYVYVYLYIHISLYGILYNGDFPLSPPHSWQILSITDDVTEGFLEESNDHNTLSSDSTDCRGKLITRREKLEAARSIFIKSYHLSVPRISINPPSRSGLGSLLNKLTGSLKLV